ncbi:MAG: hypothetical protein M1396_00620 [Chloroflexi bacterium]|nr:hypothetical protein [Chloroflexota bacterium]
MPDSEPEILDTNVVILLAEPSPRIPDIQRLLNSGDLPHLFRPPHSYSQGIAVDLLRGPQIAHQFESMRSQKSISVTATRVEVHDHSSNIDFSKAELAQIALDVAKALQLSRTQAVGATCTASFLAPGECTAATAIRNSFLRQPYSFLPEHVSLIGGGVRFFLAGKDNTTYTLVVEPRNQERTTREIWVSANVEIALNSLPEVDRITTLLRDAYEPISKLQTFVLESGSPVTARKEGE